MSAQCILLVESVSVILQDLTVMEQKMVINGIVYHVDHTCGSFGSQAIDGGKGKIRVPRAIFRYKFALSISSQRS